MTQPKREPQPECFGRYILLDKLGEGGMGRVDRAIQTGAMGFHKQVAIKRLRTESGDDKAIRALRNEARLGGQLKHPNIVETYDFGEVDGTFFLCLEFVDGITLDRLLAACDRESLRLPLSVVFEIVCAVCQALDHAHQASDGAGRPLKVVHRDLKPANIIISRGGIPQVMDFGIAKTQMHKTTTAAVAKGTPLYMSPEQIEGSDQIDSRSDLFSLGAILFELCTGKRLFEAESVANLLFRVLNCDVQAHMAELDELLPRLGEVCGRCLAKAPADRWESAAALHRALDALRPPQWAQEPGLVDLVRLLTNAYQSDGAMVNDVATLPGASADSGWQALVEAIQNNRGQPDNPLALPLPRIYSDGQLATLVRRVDEPETEGTVVADAGLSMATRAGLILLALFGFAAALVLLLPGPDDPTAPEAAVAADNTLVIAGRQFLESSIMVELFATMVEETDKVSLEVERKFHFAEPQTNFSTLLAEHDVDIYTDYTGGLLIFELNEPRVRQIQLANHRPEWINERLGKLPEVPDMEVLDRLGFENGWAITMLRSRARELGILGDEEHATLSDLARISKSQKINYMSTSKHDAQRGVDEALVHGYGVEYSSAGQLRHEQKYDWLRLGRMDVTDGFETDPDLVFNPAEFVVLEDDKQQLGYYFAVPVARRSSLERHPQLRAVFSRLAGQVSETDMAGLMRSARAQSIDSVVLPNDMQARAGLQRLVRGFLVEKGILGGAAAAPDPGAGAATP